MLPTNPQLECRNLQVFWFVNKNEDYYENNMTPPEPHMIAIVGRQIMENRHRKLMKLQYNKEKSMGQKQENCPSESQNADQIHELLPYLQNQSFSEFEFSRNEGQPSYDSSVHDMFEDQEEQMIIRDSYSDPKHLQLDKSILNIRHMPDSELVIDFKTVRPTNSTHLRPLPDNVSNKSPVISVSPPPPQLMHSSRMQTKKSSFMEYYNSLSKTTTSSNNILQKYIRSKRCQ